MGDQQKACLTAKIAADYLPACHIQVVGRLVDEKEVSLPEKEQGQQTAGPLAGREGVKGPGQDFLADLQVCQLPVEPPRLHVRGSVFQDFQGGQVRFGDGKREEVGGNGGKDGPGLGREPVGQQTQKGGFAPAVAGDETGAPVGVQPKIQVVKDSLGAAGIGKGKIGDLQ